MDEGYTINAVISIIDNGSTILDSGQNYFCPVYCRVTAGIVSLFGNDASSYRIISVIAGILLIIAVFYISRTLFSKNVALLSSFFVTFSYWQIAWSRQARWYTLFSLFFWLALYFFYQCLYSAKNRILNICLTTVFTVLSVLTHGLGYLLPLIFVSWILIDQILIQRKFNWKKSLGIIVSGAIIMWLFKFISNVDILPYLFNNLNLHYVLPYYLNFYLRTYWLFIVFAVFAFFRKNNAHKKETYFLLFIMFAYVIPLSFFTNIVHYRYMFHLTPIFFMLGSIGIVGIYSDIKPVYGKIIFALAVLVLFVTVAGGVFVPRINYYLESDNPATLGKRPHYAYTPQPDWNSAYGFIKENMANGDIVISSHPQFNKIFLGTAGYWIKYNYLGFDDQAEFSRDDREYYVGAKIIDDLEELRSVTSESHGFIVFDYMAADGRIKTDILDYVNTNFTLVFHDKINSYSEVWVYGF